MPDDAGQQAYYYKPAPEPLLCWICLNDGCHRAAVTVVEGNAVCAHHFQRNVRS